MNRTNRKSHVVLRLLVLIVPAIIATFFYCLYISSNTRISLPVKESEVEKTSNGNDLNEALNNIKNLENKLFLLTNLPEVLPKYNYYAGNNVFLRTINGDEVVTELAVCLSDSCKEDIKLGEEKVVFSSSTLDSFKQDKVAYSFEYYYKNNNSRILEEMPYTFIENRNFIYFYLDPTFFTKVIIFIFILTAWYSILLLFSGFYKFIRFGKPFTEDKKTS